MKKFRLLSLLTAAAISISSFAALAVTANAAEDVTYTWTLFDHKNDENTYVADDSNKETTPDILYVYNKVGQKSDGKILGDDGSVVDSAYKAASLGYGKALSIKVPNGKAATIEMELSNANNCSIYLTDDETGIDIANAKLTVTINGNDQKKVMNKSSASLDCGKTYYLYSSITNGNIYVGPITLTVTPKDENPDPDESEKPSEEPSEEPSDEPTESAVQQPFPVGTIWKAEDTTSEDSVTLEDGTTLLSDYILLCGTTVFDEAGSRINLKNSAIANAIKIIPAGKGQLVVSFASTSDAARTIEAYQGEGAVGTATSPATKYVAETLTVTVDADEPVYLYSKGSSLCVYSIELKAVSEEPDPTPVTVQAENIGAFKGENSDTVATAFKAKLEDISGVLKLVVTSHGDTREKIFDTTTLTDANAVVGFIINGLEDKDATAYITVE